MVSFAGQSFYDPGSYLSPIRCLVIIAPSPLSVTRVEPLREPPVNLVDVDIEEFPVVGIRIEILLLLDLTSFGINCRTEPSG